MEQLERVQESSGLQVQIERDGSRIVVTFAGRVDEQASLTKTWDALLPYSAETRSLSFDLAGVNAINSIGVKNWLIFVQKVEGVYGVEFSVIGEIFAELGGFIQNVFGVSGAPVHSFMVPYVCKTCQRQHVRRLTRKDLLAGGRATEPSFSAPRLPCDVCGQPMDFDGIEKEFFHFLSSVPVDKP